MTRIILKLGKISKLLILSPIWTICIIAVYCSKNKAIILSDIKRYARGGEGYKSLIYNYILGEACFGNVLYHRIHPITAYFLNLFLHGNKTLHISTTNIGSGLLIVHGDSTYIYAKSLGKDAYINQCVTIGVKGSSAPIIGDNVRIATGSIVIGGIIIGNNVTIGAGSVVTKNIPDNCTVVGNPARIIRKNGIKVNIQL